MRTHHHASIKNIKYVHNAYQQTDKTTNKVKDPQICLSRNESLTKPVKLQLGRKMVISMVVSLIGSVIFDGQ